MIPARLVLSGDGLPAFNMEADETLFRSVLAGGPPTLRFYAWNPPSLSLGRFQEDPPEATLAACRAAGIGIVRRPTGGRGVLHHREITYSLTSRCEGPFAGAGLVETYRIIAGALVRGLARLGAEVVEGGRDRSRRSDPNCFAAPARREITWHGRKLAGSAQVREREGFLQHGALLLSVDRPLWRAVFPGEDPSETAVGLDEVLGRQVLFDEAAAALAEGFSEILGLDLNRDG
jgi:lipoate-protein ligase A